MSKKVADAETDKFMHMEAMLQRPDLFPRKGSKVTTELAKIRQDAPTSVWGMIKNKVLKSGIKVK